MILHETPLHAARLQADLLHLAPVKDYPEASILLSAIAALEPDIHPATVLAAWPRQPLPLAAAWRTLLGNLGYQTYGVKLSEVPRLTDSFTAFIGKTEIAVGHTPGAIWLARGKSVRSKLPANATILRLAPRAPDASSVAELGKIRRYLGTLMPSLFMSSLMVQGLGVLVPLFIMVVYDHVLDARAPVGYHGLVLGLSAVLLLEGTLRSMRAELLARAGTRAEALAANTVVAHLLHLPLALLERATLSSQLSRLRGVELMRDIGTSPLILGILDVPFVVLMLGVLGWIGGPLVFIPLGLLVAYGLMFFTILPSVKKVLAAQAHAHEERQLMVLETCQHAIPLRSDGLTEHWLDRLEDVGRRATHYGEQGAYQQHVLEAFSLLAGSLAGLATLAMGVEMVLGGHLTAGALVASMMLVWRLLAPISLLCTALPRLVQLGQTYAQLKQFLELSPENSPLSPAPTGQLPPAAPRGEWRLHQVGLRFMREYEAVFTNLTVTLPAGSLTVVLGANGSGKSSLLKLLLALYPIQAGTIRLDGADLRQWDAERLRRHIAYLPQQPDPIRASIAANLRLANPLATENQLWHVLAMSGADETIRQFDDGLDHMIEEPENLTGLLAHQLNLSRFYLHTGKILLADELPGPLLATPAGETYFRWLAAQKGHRTTLVVSSHESILALADNAIGLLGENVPLIGVPEKVARQVFAHNQHTLNTYTGYRHAA